MATPMISHRLRVVASGVPIVLMSALLVAGPAFAADALRITTPLAGTTVSGPLTVEGVLAGENATDLELGLAPQVLGDCGAPLVSSSFSAGGEFVASMPTAGLPDGAYCLIAVADGGRLSAVVADIAVTNASDEAAGLEGFQLPTQSLGASATEVPAGTIASAQLDDVPALGAAVLAIALALAAVVMGTGLWVRRRTTD